MKTYLYIDDVRNPFDDIKIKTMDLSEYDLVWIKSYDEVIQFLQTEWPDIIDFDHDLGTEQTGYDIAKYIVNICLDKNYKLPEFYCHSANPCGKENILSLLQNFKEKWNQNLK